MSEVDLELEEFKKGFRQVDYSKLSREELNEEYDERSTLEKTAMAPVELAVGVVGGAGDLMEITRPTRGIDCSVCLVLTYD